MDPSIALLYYAPGGKQKIIGDDEEYKNKHFLKDKPKCYRYGLTDHYSDSVCVRYYAERGETAATRYDFLLYAWGQKPLNTYVFHGVPELLIWDCGSGNIAKATTNALTAFGVKTVPHLPGNPRGKGQLVGMEVRVQPIPVSAQPVCMVSYEHDRETVSFEVEPIQYDEAGFRLDAPVFGKQYQRPKDTVREQHAKGFEQGGVEAVMG
ncbi:MAG: transposase family protein, partial [Treponema sp.]|nr:transposase family protein [Treponema sp.]